VQRTASRNADLSAIDLRTKRDDMHWPWWRYADDFFEEPCRGFQPLCRLSARLVRAVLDFRVRHGEFTFHEVLFASVARREGMSWLSWNCDAGFRHFVSRFRYRPEIREVAGGICHPVKNPAVHAAICAAPPPEFLGIPTRKGQALVADPSRRSVRVPGTPVEAASKYVGGGGSGWFPEDWLAWSVLFGRGDKPVRVLETGAGSGAGACLMLDLLFTHLESEAHCIDLYDGEAGAAARAAFESNAGAGGHGGRLHLYEGLSREVLAWMIAEEGYWESFDFIRLGGSASGPGLLADACQAWALLKPGGVMVFDGRTGERAAAGEAFLGVYAGQLQKVLVGERMVVAKQAR
jgi:hypothetical protein